MKTWPFNVLSALIAVILSLISTVNYGQAPDLRSTSSFALFSAAGAFNADGALTNVKGDVGTNVGAFNAFPPGILVGQKHVADPASAQAATDVDLVYSDLSAVTCGPVISSTMGSPSGQTLLPGVYCIGEASTINGDLILDGQGDPGSVFIFKIDGALATTVDSRIILTGGASICNVYWQVSGEVDLGEHSVFQGTIVGGGAIHLLEGAELRGRGLTRAGEIALHNNVVTTSFQPIASIIMATGPTTFCAGGSVTLTGNVGGTWSNNETGTSINVTSSGDYFVTNTTGCGTSTSNHIIVTVNPLPVASLITAAGPTTFCAGGSVILSGNNGGTWSNGATTESTTVSTAGDYYVTNSNGCGDAISNHITVTISAGATASTITAGGATTFCAGGSVVLSGNSGGTWSNGETNSSITVTAGGDYFVTNTNACGDVMSNHIAVTVNPLPPCDITGSSTICAGQLTQLCAPAGASGYFWSTGEKTSCITVSAAGKYTVTVTNSNGCTSQCDKTITVIPAPSCTITGSTVICEGKSTQLCVPAGALKYVWSTGEKTNCITVSAAGKYTVTVTNANRCSSTCSKTVTVTPLPSCTITGNNITCQGKTTELCAPAGCATYKWSTGATTRCITVSSAGTYSITVTNSNGCSSTCSKTITATPAPSCLITGNNITCQGKTTELCAPAGCATYKWSTGATTRCITVSSPGTYSITVTNSNGCSSTCSKTITASPPPNCTITGGSTCDKNKTTQLCAPAGCATYKWSTGATTSCITVSAAGTYSVTVTSAGGCSSTCSKTITTSTPPPCSITGSSSICKGKTTQLCAPSGCASYKWSTGATTSCITVNCAGTFTVTVTKDGGTSTCSKTVTVTNPPSCTITGNFYPKQGQTTSLSAPAGCASYKWSTGATTSSISVKTAGTYTVTVTNSGGCSASGSACVSYSAARNAPLTNTIISLETGTTFKVKAYPNPFNSRAIIEFQNDQSASHTVIELYNITGNKLAVLFDGDVKQGVLYSAGINAGNLPSGIYTYRIITGDQIINKKIILLK